MRFYIILLLFQNYSLLSAETAPDSSTKASLMLLAVFFNEYDACIVTSESLELISKLNPQTKERLKIIKSSPGLLAGIICYNNNIIGTDKEEILDSIPDNLHNNESGIQLLSLFSIDKLVSFNENHVQSLIQISNRLGK